MAISCVDNILDYKLVFLTKQLFLCELQFDIKENVMLVPGN